MPTTQVVQLVTRGDELNTRASSSPPQAGPTTRTETSQSPQDTQHQQPSSDVPPSQAEASGSHGSSSHYDLPSGGEFAAGLQADEPISLPTSNSASPRQLDPHREAVTALFEMGMTICYTMPPP